MKPRPVTSLSQNCCLSFLDSCKETKNKLQFTRCASKWNYGINDDAKLHIYKSRELAIEGKESAN